MLFTDGDDRLDALRSGEAMSAVLLEATMAGLATCTVTHVTELPTTQAPAPTPRRPLEHVLQFGRHGVCDQPRGL